MMPIRSTMQVEKPDAVEVTLAVTMTLGEWKSVVEDLARPNMAGRHLREVIRDAVNRMEGKIHGESTTGGG